MCFSYTGIILSPHIPDIRDSKTNPYGNSRGKIVGIPMAGNFIDHHGENHKMNDDKGSLAYHTDTAFPIAATCPGKIEIPTKKEQEALARMKTIKENVRELKSTIKALQKNDPENNAAALRGAEKELCRMKVEWETWEFKRKQAAKERMIHLGHEEPSQDLSVENS
jgi:hypothetical protein